jgi:DNA-directed RNA polymerase subunit M/transcription elongation factor TFIIS
MTEQIDSQGRWILTNEPCRFCGADSKLMHPAGVVSGRWTCTRCGGRQHDAPPVVETTEEFKRSRKSEATP